MIRKQKREESLAKRRFLALDRDDASTVQPAATAGLPAATAAGAFAAPANVAPAAGAISSSSTAGAPRVEELPRYGEMLRSGNPALELEATRAIRRLLSVETRPPVDAVLAMGVLPVLVSFIRRHEQAAEQLLFEAAWALTNIASTQHTRALVTAGATPPLALLLLNASPDVREQAAWCLGNIAGDCPELRDVVLASGVSDVLMIRQAVHASHPNASQRTISPFPSLIQQQALENLLKNIVQPTSTTMLRNCVWALSNFARGKPQPHLDVLRPALPVLAKILNACQDTDCLQVRFAVSVCARVCELGGLEWGRVGGWVLRGVPVRSLALSRSCARTHTPPSQLSPDAGRRLGHVLRL